MNGAGAGGRLVAVETEPPTEQKTPDAHSSAAAGSGIVIFVHHLDSQPVKP